MKNLQISKPNDLKLVTVTRQDISLGAIIAQTVHSSTTFAKVHPELFNNWITTSDYVACLATRDEEHLLKYYERLIKAGATVYLFREPDLKNQATSFCFYGTPEFRKITSSLPLMFKNKEIILKEESVMVA